jgi:quercetin dioxygenase-like cupin family protein
MGVMPSDASAMNTQIKTPLTTTPTKKILVTCKTKIGRRAVSKRSAGFVTLKLTNGLMHEHDDGRFRTLVFGFAPKSTLQLPDGCTHFGIVVGGCIKLTYPERVRTVEEGDFFSVSGRATIDSSNGLGMISSAFGYSGLNVFGGPIEPTGRLRYIDGCTDTLLVPPVRKGNPCLNHLHFPNGIVQTPHTHPSIRSGMVYRGQGVCVIQQQEHVPLIPGYAFIIETNAVHSFNTQGESMDVIAFHPDSDTGMTDDDHPMINRTIVGGVSARHLEEIRTLDRVDEKKELIRSLRD